MTNTNHGEAERLIIDFLNQHANPTTKNWKMLLERFPQHATAIADAAIVRAAGDAMDESAEPYELDTELANRTVSKALSKIHQTPSWNLEAAKRKASSIQKPADRRQTASDVGIGPYPTLLNGILSGRTKAPSKVLGALAALFEVPRLALVEVLRRCFEDSVVPAFKGGDNKPQVAAEPVSWEHAVRSLELSEEETTRLLQLAEED
ncbi:MAG: hypothetical protein IAE88_10550 [Rhodobacteraceae bacterium]|nr:hypothetical protein [Paracoccaceae bacterium]